MAHRRQYTNGVFGLKPKLFIRPLANVFRVTSRLVVLESGLGLESGLKSIFAGLGLGLGLGL